MVKMALFFTESILRYEFSNQITGAEETEPPGAFCKPLEFHPNLNRGEI
jgi:hypothetical protein